MTDISTEVAVLTETVETLAKRQEKGFEKLFLILEGNGNVGIKTQTELNRRAIAWMWKSAGIGIALTSLVFGAIRILS